MIFGKAKPLNKKIIRIKFAWLPIVLDDNSIIWLEKYKNIGYYYRSIYSGNIYWMSVERIICNDEIIIK
jgi:hypothetical protein